MRLSISALLVTFTLLPLQPAVAQSVSVVISEQTVNDFFNAMGTVTGKGKGKQKISFTWQVKNPQVDFEPGTAGFQASVKVKTKIGTFTDVVKGELQVDYDPTANKIRMQVVEAKMPIRVKLLGKRVKIATLDIGKYYQPRFEFNGPEPVQREVEVDVGGDAPRIIAVETTGEEVTLEHDQLRVSVNLVYTGQ